MESTSISQNSGSRRAKALFWLTGVASFIAVLLYFEQIAVIYVLSTLGLIILLLTVALADLESVGADRQESPENVAKENRTAPQVRQIQTETVLNRAEKS